MNRADENVDLVTLDQPVSVLRRDFWLGFIVELDDLQLAPAKPAAFSAISTSMATVMFSPSLANVPE